MRNHDRYAEDRVSLRWILLLTGALALFTLFAQGVYLSHQAKLPIEFLGQ